MDTSTVGSWKIHFIVNRGSKCNFEFAGGTEFTTTFPFFFILTADHLVPYEDNNNDNEFDGPPEYNYCRPNTDPYFGLY